MTTKVVVRLLDAENCLLGWTEVQAVARGDGQLWCTSRVDVLIEQTGEPAWLSVHWADVNIEVEPRTPVSLGVVRPGAVFTFFPPGPILRVGPMPGVLPAVTVRAPVGIAIDPAQMGAQG